MLRSAMKGRLMKKLTVLLMAGAIVAIALPGVAGKKNITLLACNEGSHSNFAPPTPPAVDTCQATSGAAQAVCAQPACTVTFGLPRLPACTGCLDLLADAGCKRKEVDFSCVGPLDRVRNLDGKGGTQGIVCVKNFVFECPGIDDDDDDD